MEFRNVQVTSPGKLIALVSVILGCFGFIIVAAVQGSGDTTPAWATITLVVGYLVGNGTGAARGLVNVSTFAPTTESQLQTTKTALETLKRDHDNSGEILRPETMR